MPPIVALAIWFVLVVALFVFDPAKDSKASWALWVPLTFLFFVGSRSPAIWLTLQTGNDAVQALEEGNPVDRAIFSILILLAIAILLSRSFRWGEFFARNGAFTALLVFALLSVAWSDFPFTTFRKWFRDLGEYVVILVVLTDSRPLEAICTVLRRLFYLFMTMSIVLIKYYPRLGKSYSDWGGVSYGGVTTGKNLLALLCVLSITFFFWDILTCWSRRKEVRIKRVLWVDLAFILMSLWLFGLAPSATCKVCLSLGCLILAVAQTKTGKNHAILVELLAPATFGLFLILTFGFNMSGNLAEAVGKDPTLSDRTVMWTSLMHMQRQPIFGYGYQSFFLGNRIETFWDYLGGDNVHEAHSGYLSVYLDLGILGLCLIGIFLIASYRNICMRLKPFIPLGSLGVAYWTILLFFNVTEAAFTVGFLWSICVMLALKMPERVEDLVFLPALYHSSSADQSAELSREIVVEGR